MNEFQIQPVLTTAAALITDPTVLAVLAVLILGLVPNSHLERLPLIGNTVKAFADAWARKKLRDYAEQQAIIETEAKRIVESKEQLIKTGRLDSATAKAQAMQELIGTFNLAPVVADRFVESEVHHLQSPLQLISGTALTSGSDLN